MTQILKKHVVQREEGAYVGKYSGDEGERGGNNMLATCGSDPGLACRQAHPSQQPRPNTATHRNFTAELEHANSTFLAEVI